MDDKRLAAKPLSDAVKADLVRDYHKMLCKFAAWAYQRKRGRHFGTYSDWYQEAAVALIEAGERFDLTRGFRFITFAYSWVRGRLLHKEQNAGLIHVPRTRTIRFLRESQSALEKMGDVYVVDPIGEDDEYDRPEIPLHVLTPRQREVIRRYYGFGGTEQKQDEIAKAIGCGRAAVSYYHRQAIERLWEEIRAG